MEKITKEFLTMLYKGTCQSNNGLSFEDAIKNMTGERMDVVCVILSRMRFNGGRFNSIVISSDGGIKDFFVTYRFGKYSVLVERFIFSYFPEWPFESVQGFADWLNNQEKKIIATAVLEVTP
jgi:hypothetical protein